MTRSKAKMYEYRVPPVHHIEITSDLAILFPIAICQLGDLAARVGSGEDGVSLNELRSNVRFAAQFFDSYLDGRLEEPLTEYLRLVGSASYYLGGLPGSAAVLASRLPNELTDLGGAELERLAAWLLKGEYEDVEFHTDGVFYEEMESIAEWMQAYIGDGSDEDELDSLADDLRTKAYACGSPRELLFADIVAAVVRTRRRNSTWYSLPRYSELDSDLWNVTLRKGSFIRELWPSQMLIGEFGLLRGRSGIVQMPTSAGKTRATELIIRSEFLAERTELAVIVAPFRALCHEIRNALLNSFRGERVAIDEISDVFQPDFNVERLLSGRRVVVITPEKLVYVLRHNPELAEKIGLLIYDEGHQFDNGSRGVTYELLVTSLKSLVPGDCQTVLISAVISNAEAINEWLNGADAAVVKGTFLNPTFRSIGFASWETTLGQIQFVKESNPDIQEFFVPRLIESAPLAKKGRETKIRYFPTKGDGSSVALHLGLTLCPSGSVAVFTGRKDTASSLCAMAADIFERGVPLTKPRDSSTPDEVRKLTYLHKVNLGKDSPATRASRLGIFAHHGSTPHGLRLAIEHAMRKADIRMVICTSTLAQGVNLPIRYLIVASTQQGREKISVRDFHNLIGRAGRSGIHTEGSVLFANPEIYDERKSKEWRWDNVRYLLKAENTEPCASTLLSFLRPIESDNKKWILELPIEELLAGFRLKSSKREAFINELVSRNTNKLFSESRLRYQIQLKWQTLTALESYLLAHWDEAQEVTIAELAKRTLAYHLCTSNDERNQLVLLFENVADNIEVNVPEEVRRRIFGRTLLGVRDALAIEKSVRGLAEKLTAATSEEDVFKIIWPVVRRHIHNSVFVKCNNRPVLTRIARGWLHGLSFAKLLQMLTDSGARIGLGQRAYHPTIEHAVELCENGLAFDGMLIVGAIAEVFEFSFPEEEATANWLRALQKRLKYGLKTVQQILLYEMGISDRVIVQELATFLESEDSRNAVRRALRQKRDDVARVVEKVPSYFAEIIARLLS
jgi:superfamily II DNA/RNA helicase